MPKTPKTFGISLARRFVALGTSAALLPAGVFAVAPAPEQIFETNVTNDLTITSGEPQIAVDPTNPRNLAIVEFASGSAQMPAHSFVANADPHPPIAAMINTGRVMISRDGGDHWVQQGAAPAYDPNFKPHRGGGDPFIAWSPDGILYVGDEAGPDPETAPGKTLLQSYGELLPRANLFIAASKNGGRTFGRPQSANTPIDRPWMTVDRTTGTLYTVSSGEYSPTTKIHNAPAPDAPNERWLVAWKPNLAGKSEPRRLGGPDFSGAAASTITAAHGVVAATFTLGGPVPGGGPARPGTVVPVPASLQGNMKDGVTTCSMKALCLFFETSSDQGAHWTRHHVPVAGGFSARWAQVSADPGLPGRYAIAVLNPAGTNYLILLTDDSGATWAPPVMIPEAAAGVDFKQWMDYGPTGVLGLVWKKQRDDLTPPHLPEAREGVREAIGPAFDVYSTISCDGGKNWQPPVRINAETSPAGPPGSDDLSYIALDAKYAHMVWGDRRMLPKVKNVPGASGGLQAYYGRVPFSALTNGAPCGRGAGPGKR